MKKDQVQGECWVLVFRSTCSVLFCSVDPVFIETSDMSVVVDTEIKKEDIIEEDPLSFTKLKTINTQQFTDSPETVMKNEKNT